MQCVIDRPLTVDQYVELLRASTLGERRPIDQPDVITAMLEHANLLATAWEGELLVGAARCFTDYRYVTYCSDLCVRASHQKRGIGRVLLERVLQAAPCRIVLLAAPKAVDYYPRIGFAAHPSAWVLEPGALR